MGSDYMDRGASGLPNEDSGLDFGDPDVLTGAIIVLKFGLLVSISRAPEKAIDDTLLDFGWLLLNDETIYPKLEEYGALEEATSCIKMGQSHWYLSRLDLGNVLDGELLVMVDLMDNVNERLGKLVDDDLKAEGRGW